MINLIKLEDKPNIVILFTEIIDNNKLFNDYINNYTNGKPYIEINQNQIEDKFVRVIMTDLSEDLNKDWDVFKFYIRDKKINQLLKK